MEPLALHRARARELSRPARERGGPPAAELGAGIVSGASDNDPTTVATLAVIGATTVYRLAWLVLLIIPMLVVVQAISAAIGCIGKRGLEDIIRRRYGRGWAIATLVAVLAVTILTLAADLEGGAAALGLLSGLPYAWFVVPFAIVAGALLIVGSYAQIEKVLKFIPLIFLAYIASAVLARPDWHAVLADSLVPKIDASPGYIAGAIALLGTTLTSYAYVWETIEVAHDRPSLRRLGLVQVDAAAGMIFAGVTFFFIVVATGATLGVHHKDVQTAQDAAAALAPVAGKYASLLFGAGLFGSALLAVPVLAGTSAYVISETFGWRGSLDSKFPHGMRFYATLIAALAAGTIVASLGFSPIKLLFYSGIAGGLGTPLTLAFLMLIARDRGIMGEKRIGVGLAVAGWAVFVVVVGASLLYLSSLVRQH